MMKELTRRGFVLHYVVDNTLGRRDLAEVLIYLPQLFRTAGLAVTGPQLMAADLMLQEDVPLEISGGDCGVPRPGPRRRRRGGQHLAPGAPVVVLPEHGSRRRHPALSMDVALSACDDPKAIVVFRQLLPVPGTSRRSGRRKVSNCRTSPAKRSRPHADNKKNPDEEGHADNKEPR